MQFYKVAPECGGLDLRADRRKRPPPFVPPVEFKVSGADFDVPSLQAAPWQLAGLIETKAKVAVGGYVGNEEVEQEVGGALLPSPKSREFFMIKADQAIAAGRMQL